jgi:hypothetical protein
LDSNWGIPLWIDYVSLSSLASTTDTTLNVSSIQHRHFYEGGYCIILYSQDSYEYKKIEAITDTTISLTSGLSAAWASGTAVYPLMVSRLGVNIDNKHLVAGILNIEISAQEMFYSDLNNSASEPSYLEYFDPEDADIYPLYVLSPDHNWIAQRKTKMINKYDDLQYLADQYLYNHWTETGQIHDFVLNLYSREEIYQIENLFKHLKGRCFSFFLPSGTVDLKLSNNVLASSTTLPIENTGFADYYTDSGVPYTTSKYLEIKQSNGTKRYVEISSATNTVLTLTDQLGFEITDYENCIVSIMAEARFMQDEIQVEYLSQTIAKTSFSCRWESGDIVSRYDMNYTPA